MNDQSDIGRLDRLVERLDTEQSETRLVLTQHVTECTAANRDQERALKWLGRVVAALVVVELGTKYPMLVQLIGMLK